MKTLIIVDLQNDFVPGGALEVREGDQVVPIANALMSHFDLIVATQDWHPAGHGSFASQHPGKKTGDIIQLRGLDQVLWPDHCVQNSHGAQLVKALHADQIHHIFHKGTHREIDSYSTFFDNAHLKSTGLGDFLQEHGAKEVYLLGLATDYCVKFSVLDACHLGFDTTVIIDACRGVELQPGDTKRAIEEMKSAGARIITSDVILRREQAA